MGNGNGELGQLEIGVDFFELVTHVPVGICKFLLNDCYTLIYGNQAIYDLLGYTVQQFRDELNNSIIKTFLNEESCCIKGHILEDAKAGSPGFRIEHRLVRRDGSIVWVLVSGSYTKQGDVTAANGVVIDITEQKQLQEQLRIDEERMRLALAQTDSSIFDYNILTKTMIHADKSAEIYGLSSETQNVPDCLVETKVVHPDCAEEFLDMYRQICQGEPTASCVIQARTIEDRYIWQKITMTTIYDHSGKPVRAVGVLEDIDQQTRREEQLLERSRRDPLTSLYNKGTTEAHIRTYLENKSGSGALFIIDEDSFKEVNDRYGHLFGDLVLAESARRITKLCRPEDIIGRIGGDEFLIYLDGELSLDAALRKAEEICNAFLPQFSYNAVCAVITCTVGLALCPKDGDTFELLYQKADIALYSAKRNGKNGFSYYQPHMNDNMEWTPYSNTQIDEPARVVSLPHKS